MRGRAEDPADEVARGRTLVRGGKPVKPAVMAEARATVEDRVTVEAQGAAGLARVLPPHSGTLDATTRACLPRAGERVLEALRGCYARLALKVNESKTAVGRVWGRKFLGYCFRAAGKGRAACLVAFEALARLRERLRLITGRQRGRSIAQVVDELRAFVPGWKAYFRLATSKRARRELDEWLRHRLRALHLKHWRRGTTIYRELRRLGASSSEAALAAAPARRWWHTSAHALNRALSVAYFDRLGVPRFS